MLAYETKPVTRLGDRCGADACVRDAAKFGRAIRKGYSEGGSGIRCRRRDVRRRG
jgi:hypothetical protein